MEFVLIIGCLVLLGVAIDSAMNMSRIKNVKEQRAYKERFTLSAGALAIIVVCFLFQVLVTSYRESESQGHSAVKRLTGLFASKTNEREETSTWRPEGKRSDGHAGDKTGRQEVVEQEPPDEEQEIRRFEKAFAKTLRITPDEFQRHFNESVDKLGYDQALKIDAPKTKRGNVHYKFGDGVEMVLSIDNITQNVKDISVTVTNSDASAVAVCKLVAVATNPKLTESEIADIANLSSDTETVHNGFKYTNTSAEGVLKFTISVD